MSLLLFFVGAKVGQKSPGGGITGGYFARGKWHEIRDGQRRKKRELEEEILARKLAKKAAKERSIREAEEARVAKLRSEREAGSRLAEEAIKRQRVINDMAALAGAQSLQQVLGHANHAQLAALARAIEDQDEDEAITLLLSAL